MRLGKLGLSARLPLHNLYVAHLLKPLPTGAQIKMHNWPRHITLAGNFFTAAEPERIATELAELASETKPLSMTLTGLAQFGEHGEYRLHTLSKTPAIEELHARLVALVKQHGFFENPQFTLGGYNPHITVVPDELPLDPAAVHRVQVGNMTLFDIDAAQNRRAVLNTFEFARKPSARET